MPDATTKFFDDLAAREHEPRLAKVSGTIRFDLTNGKDVEPWLVQVKRGDVKVVRGNGDADSVIRSDAGLFNGIAAGEVNAMAALLRGAITLEGDNELVVVFQRLFPGPPARAARKRS